jgi:DNA-binding response OmpR family regulator
MNILVIDDDHLVRYALSRILQRGGHQVMTAADGVSGMALLRAEDPDVVITDLIMPQQEGFQTIVMMKRERPGLKIIAITGGLRHRNHDALSMASALGADEVLAKPFEPRELLDRLNRVAG